MTSTVSCIDRSKPDSSRVAVIGQLECASSHHNYQRPGEHELMHGAKLSAMPISIVGHVTKGGAIAGPRILEHIVDVVPYLEGEPFSVYRLSRGVRNRFGSTDEVDIFQMKGERQIEVDNPSQVFVSRQ